MELFPVSGYDVRGKARGHPPFTLSPARGRRGRYAPDEGFDRAAPQTEQGALGPPFEPERWLLVSVAETEAELHLPP